MIVLQSQKQLSQPEGFDNTISFEVTWPKVNVRFNDLWTKYINPETDEVYWSVVNAHAWFTPDQYMEFAMAVWKMAKTVLEIANHVDYLEQIDIEIGEEGTD